LQTLYSIDPNTGAFNWVWEVPHTLSLDGNDIFTYGELGGMALANNGNIITLFSTDTLVCIDPENHNIIWRTPASTWQDYKFISPDGFLYLYDQFTGFYFYNVSTGIQEGGPLTLPTRPTFDSGGHLVGVFSDNDPYLIVTDNTGKMIWENRMDGFYGWSVAISSDNIVYIANGKKLYAIQSDAPLANKGWPKFSHDNRNTFNYSKH